jgi:UDP-glucose 4-epimerase
MRVLVTGGAGYIGSHVVRKFLEGQHHVIAYDDLTTGRKRFIPNNVRLVCEDIHDLDEIMSVLIAERIDTVVHCAGYKFAGESVHAPFTALYENTVGTAHVIEASLRAGVKNLIFSSSAAIYGPSDQPVNERSALEPASPYGESKAAAERFIEAAVEQFGIRATSLRYFNVVGSGYAGVYDASPHNLFPVLVEHLKRGETPTVYGTDFDTPDGTAVRDYVHVTDVTRAHVLAASALAHGKPMPPALNLGTETGYSVREVMGAFGRIVPFTYETAERRAGDPARIVADARLAHAMLGWSPEMDLDEMVRSAWDAAQ